MTLLLVLGPMLLPEYRDPLAARTDVPSAVLSIGAILSAVYGLKQVVQDGMSLVPALAMLLGLVLAAIFVRRQRTLDDPLLDLDLFRNSVFSAALSCNVLNVFVSFGSFILISQYLQLVRGLSPLQAGLLALPASLLAIAGPMLTPVLLQRVGAPLTVGGLLAICGVGFGVMVFVAGPLAAVIVGAGWALWAFGGSAAATLTTGTLMSSAPPERAGTVSALAQTGAELGGALGIAVLGSLGTAIYRGAIAAALPNGISPELAAAAHDTLGGAVTVASRLPDAAAAANLVVTAQDALTLALHIVCALGAAISFASAVAAAYYLRPRPSEPLCESDAQLEAAALAA